jgi:hypothetical protein
MLGGIIDTIAIIGVVVIIVIVIKRFIKYIILNYVNRGGNK